MAQPSSSHHERDRHRSERSSHSHRHHRTISSTTLLLILSLVLAVLAVMLSLPAGTIGGHHGPTHVNNPIPNANHPNDPSHIEPPIEKNDGGLFAYLSPKRTQQLISRERDIALREAEVARREAEILAGAPGGVIPAPPPVVACPACPTATAFETVFAPAQTVIKEIVKEESLAPPGWNGARAEELFDRELKIAEREREITKREEGVNRREHDASRREAWIMEQLISLGNDNPQRVDEEYHYEPVVEPPPPPKRKVKKVREAPVVVEAEYEEIKTVVQTETITVPAPASTRRAAHPVPEPVTSSMTTGIPRTTSIEYVREEVHDEYEEEEEEEEEIVVRKPRARRAPPPNGWFGGW